MKDLPESENNFAILSRGRLGAYRWTYFIPFTGVSNVDFEQANVS